MTLKSGDAAPGQWAEILGYDTRLIKSPGKNSRGFTFRLFRHLLRDWKCC
jgi:hypothetical protein